MKKTRKILSLFLVIFLIYSSSVICSFAESDDVDARLHSVKGYLIDMHGYDEAELLYETVDNVDYIYTVLDGEASIINVHNQYRGEEKIVFTFPTTLGGYPVTTIGDSERHPEVFWYINYGEEVEYDYDYYPEYDPANKRYSRIVIPEGYENIFENALFNWEYIEFSLPKSLKIVERNAFCCFYTETDNLTGKRKSVIPECFFRHDSAESFGNSIVLHSRNNMLFSFYTFELDWGWYGGDIYVPSNVSYTDAKQVFYYYDGMYNNDYMNAKEGWYQNRFYWTVHCAPDSPWLQVIEDMGGHKYATIITDVTPAEYIEFPEETVNINVGEVMDLEAKTYPIDAIWTACDYTVSDPSIVKIDEYSGRITALKEGTVTVTATHCERGYVDTCTVNVTTKPEPGVNGIEPATDTPYVAYGSRDYKINVTGSPSKIQVVRDNGGTTTIDRRKATVTSNGDTETWIVNMRVEAGTHNIRAKYGKVWDEKLTPFTVEYDLPKAYSCDLVYENGIGNFNVVTDPEVSKIQFALDNGCTLTYSQTNSYIGEDGLRHWEISRKIPTDRIFILRTKYGYTWTDTNFEVNTIM